jgi:NAD(P)-dependent dehydrogenase (short-subunit alcohol dehydrogenase family)
MRRLEGKIALITGATRGIGAAVAKALAAEGAHVVLVGRTVGALEEVDDAVRAAGSSATLVPLDLLEPEKIDQMAYALWQRFGRLDILIGNAGILGTLGPLGHLDPPLWDKVIAVNLTANWRLIRAFDPLLRLSEGGRALFTTCAIGREPTAYWSAYAVAKAGLEMMVATWGAELGLTKVKVGVIDPGPVRTGLRKSAFPGEDPADLKAPEDVAGGYVEAVAG